MRRTLLIASLLSLLPLAVARAEEFDFRDWYRKVTDFAASLISPAPQPKEARVPAAEIDPKMALVPRDGGRMRIVAPPGTPGGDQKLDPR